MRYIVCLSIILLASHAGNANNLHISNVTWDGSAGVTFDISWDNSWRGPGANPTFHDAVWVFIKVAPNGGPSWNHVLIDVTDEGTLDVVTPGDLMGAFVRRSSQGTGSVSGTVSFDVSGSPLGLFPDIKVFGIEMVYIPVGPYYLGDGVSTDRFHVGNDDTQPYLVSNSGAITYGTGANDLYTNSNILTANLSADYPNGYNAFYCMKYEVSQIQYAEFLNCLSLAQQDSRTETDLNGGLFTNTYVMTNTSVSSNQNYIRCIPSMSAEPLFFFCDRNGNGTPNEIDDGQNTAGNYISFDDLKAYLDWAALRPISMLEYEKVCRGPQFPVTDEYAWGTSMSSAPATYVNTGHPDEHFSNLGASGPYGLPAVNKLARCGFATTTTSTRLTSGAGYYGVMELTGNVTESVGTRFMTEDEYGDGTLDINGFADTFFINFSSKGLSIMTVSWNGSNASIGTARGSTSGGRGVR